MRSITLSPERLQAAREAAGLSKVKAAAAVGVTRATLLNAESGVCAPGSNVLARMASVYGVPMESLFVVHDEDATASEAVCGHGA